MVLMISICAAAMFSIVAADLRLLLVAAAVIEAEAVR
jgi:hypothetical protein